jgi:dUTP pyrophosphatase
MPLLLKIALVDNSMQIFYISPAPSYDRGDSGMDVYFKEDLSIEPWSVAKLEFGIRCEMVGVADRDTSNLVSTSYPFFLIPRSSIAKTPLILCNSIGVIDAGYRGELAAVVRNLSSEPYVVRRGERLFQICSPDLTPFERVVVETLSASQRGYGSFGSTGK